MSQAKRIVRVVRKRPTADSDPSGLFGAVGTTVAAVLTLLVAFGVELSAEQQAAILGVVATLGPLVTALAIRRHAWAPRTVRRALGDDQ